jgi:hypothetical protein
MIWLKTRKNLYGVLGVVGSNPITQIVYNSVNRLIFSFQKVVHNWQIDHKSTFLITLLTSGEHVKSSWNSWSLVDTSTEIEEE